MTNITQGIFMTKIVYNACHGGFSLSEAAIKRYAEIKGIKLWIETDPEFSMLTHYWTAAPGERGPILKDDEFYEASQEARIASNEAYSKHQITARDFDRCDPVLIQVVEELGDAANGRYAKLRIHEVPAGSRYRIDEYDGFESIETPDSYEWSVAS